MPLGTTAALYDVCALERHGMGTTLWKIESLALLYRIIAYLVQNVELYLLLDLNQGTNFSRINMQRYHF